MPERLGLPRRPTHDIPEASIVAHKTLLAFILTCLVIELTPGPNMAYLAVLGVSIGRRAGFAATLGIALGLLIVGLAAALGLAVVIANSRLLYEALRWAGALYLFWLAWEAWRREDTLPDTAAAGDSKYFLRGLVTNLLNPRPVSSTSLSYQRS